MADLIYNIAKKQMWDGTIDLVNDTIKCMLIASSTAYTADPDHTYVDMGGANDPLDCEAAVTNYTGGYGGAGRKSLTSSSITQDDTNDLAYFDTTDLTWSALGNGTNEVIVAGILIKEAGAADTSSTLIAFVDFTDFTSNGSDFTLQWAAGGVIQLSSFPALDSVSSGLRGIWHKISEWLPPRAVHWARRLGIRPHIVRKVRPIGFNLE